MAGTSGEPPMGTSLFTPQRETEAEKTMAKLAIQINVWTHHFRDANSSGKQMAQPIASPCGHKPPSHPDKQLPALCAQKVYSLAQLTAAVPSSPPVSLCLRRKGGQGQLATGLERFQRAERYFCLSLPVFQRENLCPLKPAPYNPQKQERGRKPTVLTVARI